MKPRSSETQNRRNAQAIAAKEAARVKAAEAQAYAERVAIIRSTLSEVRQEAPTN